MATKRRSRKGSYKLTARRRVALKKAQAISARKRKAAPNARVKNSSGRRMNTATMGGKRKSNLGRNIALTTVGVGAVSAAGIVARHKLSGSSFSRIDHPIVSGQLKKLSGSQVASLSNSAITTHGSKVTRVISYHSKKQGPLGDSYTVSYNHQPLTREQVLGKALSSKLGKRKTAQPWFESLASQYTPDRGQDRREDPKNPGHNYKGERLPTQNWVYGKKPPLNGPRKYVGSYEIFSNIGSEFPKKKIKGYTTIGGALTGKKG